MQDEKEIMKINRFLGFISPMVIAQVKMLLQASGMDVLQEGRGLDTAFHIKPAQLSHSGLVEAGSPNSGGKEAKFFVHNLLLEIATIDRDQEPLRFDERLQDFDYFVAKMAHVLYGRLRILFSLFERDDFEQAIERIYKDTKQYERIRIWRFDGQQTNKKTDITR